MIAGFNKDNELIAQYLSIACITWVTPISCGLTILLSYKYRVLIEWIPPLSSDALRNRQAGGWSRK